MSEEFDKWAATQHPDLKSMFIQRDESFFDAGYKSATESMQAKLDKQAEELSVLRGFAMDIKDSYFWTIGSDACYTLFLKHGLIDKNGKLTPLLTGEKE